MNKASQHYSGFCPTAAVVQDELIHVGRKPSVIPIGLWSSDIRRGQAEQFVQEI